MEQIILVSLKQLVQNIDGGAALIGCAEIQMREALALDVGYCAPQWTRVLADHLFESVCGFLAGCTPPFDREQRRTDRHMVAVQLVVISGATTQQRVQHACLALAAVAVGNTYVAKRVIRRCGTANLGKRKCALR